MSSYFYGDDCTEEPDNYFEARDIYNDYKYPLPPLPDNWQEQWEAEEIPDVPF